jgi:hypothetical protein
VSRRFFLNRKHCRHSGCAFAKLLRSKAKAGICQLTLIKQSLQTTTDVKFQIYFKIQLSKFTFPFNIFAHQNNPMPHPLLYQVQTRDTLYRLSNELKRKATLADIPDVMLDEWKALGFDWIWLLGVWETGEAGREMSRTRPGWQKEFHETLPDLKTEDITGSCFSIKSYTVHPDFGGEEALANIRERIHERGMKLMLDFVPNHTAPDHPWVFEHPDYYIHGNIDDLDRSPENFMVVDVKGEKQIFAHGRDPNFPGWQDTLQLDYSNPALHDAMQQELLKIAAKCDGLRCDMSMLLLPEIFHKTWGRDIKPFWPDVIRKVKAGHPDFLFLAEVYWDLEWEMQQNGFDYCYDKRLYDRLEHPYPNGIREHLSAGLDYQDRLARFLENHDEPRAAKTFPGKKHLAAAIITYFTPGMKFFHQGQLDGYKVRIPVHLNRGPEEKIDPDVRAMYLKVLSLLKDDIYRKGTWQMLDCLDENGNPAGSGLAFLWQLPGHPLQLIVINYSPEPLQCHIDLSGSQMTNGPIDSNEQLGKTPSSSQTIDFDNGVLKLELPAWGIHFFKE